MDALRGRGLSGTGPTWRVDRVTGEPADLHARALPDGLTRRLQVLEPTRSAVVLGSTQVDAIDRRVAERLGVDIVRRRSGGGAVLVGPDGPLWVDVDLPASDPRWERDVSRSFTWLGRAWADVLRAAGYAAEVREGPYQPGRWGARVCFAGRGPGEVFVDGRKVVGMAQRRTRAGARFQCALPRTWDPAPLIDLVVPPEDRDEARADLAGAAGGIDVAPRAMLDSLLERLTAG